MNLMFEVGDKFIINSISGDKTIYTVQSIDIEDKSVIVSWQHNDKIDSVYYNLASAIVYFNHRDWILDVKTKRKKKLERINKIYEV